MVGKKQLIGDVNNIALYAVLHYSADISRKSLAGSRVINRVILISEETKNYSCRYLKTMKRVLI